MTCCCFVQEAGVGGGAVLATAGRLIAEAGGRTRASTPAPSTLRCWGATVGVVGLTCADSISRRSIFIMCRSTGCADVNASCKVTVTAFGAVWFTYRMLVTFLLTTTLL